MSRAFIKDPEPGEPRCPGCGGLGDPVTPPTLEEHLPTADREPLGAAAFYCPDPRCRTAYYNAWAAAVPVERLKGPAWPKDPEAPICPCFGVRAADVLADARDGRKDRVKELVEKSKGPEARCLRACPDGVPCIPRVLRLFRETFEAR